MNTPRAAPSSTGTAAIALSATLAIQVFTALSGAAIAVLAPEVARDFGVPAKLVGVFIGLLYIGSMTASLASGHFIARRGAIRVSQLCVLLCAAGILLVALLPSTAVAMLAVAPLIIGLGYGAVTPASSELLARTARPDRLALTFSIKQTGVPGGAALAGAVLPALTVAIGWRPALLCVAACGVVIAALAQPTRRRLDVIGADRPFSLAALMAPLRMVLRDRRLAELSVVGFIYAAMQMCLMSFLVVYLTEALGYPLIAAGLALTTANVGGVAGRIVWGAIADHWIAPRRMLGFIGVATGVCAFAAANFSAAWPHAASACRRGAFRRHRDRVERRPVIPGGEARSARTGRRDHRRLRLHHLRRRRVGPAAFCAAGGRHRRLPDRLCRLWRLVPAMRGRAAGAIPVTKEQA